MIKLTHTFNKLASEIKQHQKKLEKAHTEAINKVGFDVRLKLIEDLSKYLVNPTPFTKRGWILRKATTGNKKAVVLLKDIQASYLALQIIGGAASNHVVPYKNAKLNKYGNIVGKKNGLVKRKTEFIATIKGIRGVWRRVGGKRKPHLKLIHVFEKKVNYKKKYPIFEIAEAEIKKQYQAKLNRAMEKAFG